MQGPSKLFDILYKLIRRADSDRTSRVSQSSDVRGDVKVVPQGEVICEAKLVRREGGSYV